MKTNLFFEVVSKRFLSAMAIFSAMALTAQISTFPWTETFEDSSPTIASWTQIYETNNMSWTFATSASTGSYGITAYEGTKFANFPGDSHDFDKTKLVSPVLNLSAVTNPTVSFYYINPFWDPDQNWLRVFFRTSATSPWVQLAEFHSNITTWTSSGPIGIPPNTYQIAIECETDYGYSTLVDALVVNGSNLSVDDIKNTKKSSIKYYPNPVGNILNYKSDQKIHDITIYNIAGQKIKYYKAENNDGVIDVSALSAGIYIVSGKTDSGSEIFKMIKK